MSGVKYTSEEKKTSVSCFSCYKKGPKKKRNNGKNKAKEMHALYLLIYLLHFFFTSLK